MEPKILVGTASGLWQLAAGTSRSGNADTSVETLAGRSVKALALDGASAWAVVEGSEIWERRDGAWNVRGSLDDPAPTCVAPTPAGVLVGTEQAHLFRLTSAGPERVESFESAEGRAAWYTPWGDPADVRSIAVATDATIHVNVHVGGVVRSRDGGASWAPTVDIESDVHQVLAHPTRPEIVLVAAAEGFGISRDGGDSWMFATEGLHAR